MSSCTFVSCYNEVTIRNAEVTVMMALQLFLGLGAVIGAVAAIKLVVWYPALFEINFRRVHGTRCISYVLTGAEIFAAVGFADYTAEDHSAAYGIAFIVLIAIIVFVSKKSKAYGFDFSTKLLFFIAQILSPITALVILYLGGKLYNRVNEIIWGKDENNK